MSPNARHGDGGVDRRRRWWAIRAALAVGVLSGGAALGSPVAAAAVKPQVTVAGKTLTVTAGKASRPRCPPR